MKLTSPTALLIVDTLRCMLFSGVVLLLVFTLTRLFNFGAFDLYRLTFKEFSFLDTYYAEDFSMAPENSNQEIILVNIGRLNRNGIAELIDSIQKFEPKVIGVDVIFDHQKKDSTDKKLWAALQSDNVVSAFAIQNRQLIKNHPILGVFRHQLGYANFNFDRYNSVIRNFQAKKVLEGHEYQSFALKVAQRYLGRQRTIHWPKMDEKSIPINYTGGREHYRLLDHKKLIKSDSLPPIKNKIVLLGYLGSPMGSEYDIEDKHFTPLNESFLGKSAPDTFGIVVHSNIIEMLIDNKRHYVVPNWIVLTIALLTTFFALAFFIKRNKKSIASYMLTRKLTQLGFTILCIGISLWLLSHNIYFKITELIWYVVLSIECIWAYKLFSNYLNKKFGWKSYFSH